VLAGSAFKDPEVVKQVSRFVPVLVDGDADAEFGKDYAVRGFPHTVFADPKGKKIAAVVGAVDTKVFLDEVKSALKKIGPVRLKKAAKDLEDAAEDLAKAREKKDWRATLKAAAAIEKIGHEGTALADARKAKAEAAEEAAKRLDEAKAARKDGKADEAKKLLRRIVSEFEGLDAAVEARNLLKEMDGPPPVDDDGGGGEGGDRDRRGSGR
jgi:hypothetical protein